MRRRYRVRATSLQRQAPRYTPSPHGHGFIAATSRKAAGKVTVPPARLTRITPSSSGWRNASSAATGNSPSSSRNRMPWVASETSPGRSDQLPPPTSETTEAWWCGARKGGRSNRAPSGSVPPAAEWTRVTVNASSGVSGGSRPGRRSASMVLPDPGGPTMRRWWRPAAATSMARRPRAWPRTSARSGVLVTLRVSVGGGTLGQRASPRRTATSSASVAAPRTASPRTRAASRTSHRGTTRPRGPAASARAIMPGTCRNEPLSPSSPQNATPSVQPGLNSPAATRSPIAIGRSSPAPPLRMPEGARLTVTRRSGHGRPLDRTAARTRSRASRTAASGRPTIVKPGRPLETWTSTETARPTAPLSVAEATAASMLGNGRIDLVPDA